jgi:hypothetical protein
MFKRILLTVTFIAAFSTIGIGVSNQAQAWRGGYYGYGRPYAAYYAPRGGYYYGPPVVPYRSYYAPRYVRPYYPGYYAAPAYPVYYDSYYYGPPAGVSVSFGF